MSEKPSHPAADRIAAIASQLEEHLKFYREIGITDVGGSQPGMTPTPSESPGPLAVLPGDLTDGSGASSPEPPAPESAAGEPVRVAEAGDQTALFEEVFPRRATSLPSIALPVLESSDPSLEAIREDLGDCTRCRLHEQRTRIVFGEGDPGARLMFVGEGPGADEDASGRPFVGRAGQLLNKIIAAIGMEREECYIANVVKCRPPGNRTPERDEVETCEPYLFRQIAFIKPKVIVTLGLPAFQCLLKTRETMGRARGQWREFHGIKVMPTFHPAYLLRSPEKKREVWEDMKKVRDYLNSIGDAIETLVH